MFDDDDYGEDWAFDDEDTEDENEEHRRQDNRDRARDMQGAMR